jgi:hypothetical protein
MSHVTHWQARKFRFGLSASVVCLACLTLSSAIIVNIAFNATWGPSPGTISLADWLTVSQWHSSAAAEVAGAINRDWALNIWSAGVSVVCWIREGNGRDRGAPCKQEKARNLYQILYSNKETLLVPISRANNCSRIPYYNGQAQNSLGCYTLQGPSNKQMARRVHEPTICPRMQQDQHMVVLATGRAAGRPGT